MRDIERLCELEDERRLSYRHRNELISLLRDNQLDDDDAEAVTDAIIDIVDDGAMSQRIRDLFFGALELLRAETAKTFPAGTDWKDVDDYIFSTLDFTKDELAQIYSGRNVMVYAASAIENSK